MTFAMQKGLVEQAKRLLIEKARISEAQAHRFIQKRAMDLRISKNECAVQIIERYNHSLEQKQIQQGERRLRRG